MASGILWDEKLNSLRSMREVSDCIDELEAKSYYVPEFFLIPEILTVSEDDSS